MLMMTMMTRHRLESRWRSCCWWLLLLGSSCQTGARAFTLPWISNARRGFPRFGRLAASITNDSKSPKDTTPSLVDTTLLEPLTQPVYARRSLGGLEYWDTFGQSSVFRVLFVLGGPGAGKGTQSALLQEHYGNIHHFSVGELLRNAQGEHRELIDSYLVQGQIVPVEISLELLHDAMTAAAMSSSNTSPMMALVDGFPRNADNLQGWCRQMLHASSLAGVLVYTCPLAVLEERILQRAAQSGRSDDNLTSLRRRFATFADDTLPVVDCLRQLSTASDDNQCPWAVHDMAGDESVEQVWAATQTVMNEIVMHDVVSANAALLEAIAQQDADAYRNLCDDAWFADSDNAVVVLQTNEGSSSNNHHDICNAQVDVISGKHVAVSYQRCHEGIMVRESRIWMHQDDVGWRNVHFSRQPL